MSRKYILQLLSLSCFVMTSNFTNSLIAARNMPHVDHIQIDLDEEHDDLADELAEEQTRGPRPIPVAVPVEIDEDTDVEQERAECTRPMSKAKKVAIQKSRAKDAKAVKKAFGKNKPMAKGFAPSNRTTSGVSLHFAHDVSTKGLNVEIENGAIFSIRDWDSSTVGKWQKNSPLKITPSSSWGSSHQYKLVNPSTGESAQATLSNGPFLTSPHTRRIVQLNKTTGDILLDNGSYFTIGNSSSNYAIVAKWAYNDIIIVGDNDSWFTFGCNNILINVATDDYVTACLN